MSPEQEKRITSIVARVCARTTDIADAAEQIRCRLAADESLYAAVIEEAIGTAIKEYIYRYQARARTTARAGVLVGAEPETDAQERRRAFADAILDNWPVNGRRLGDCDGAMLEDAAVQEEAVAIGHQRVAAFYRALARKAGAKALRDVMDNAQVQAIYRRTIK